MKSFLSEFEQPCTLYMQMFGPCVKSIMNNNFCYFLNFFLLNHKVTTVFVKLKNIAFIFEKICFISKLSIRHNRTEAFIKIIFVKSNYNVVCHISFYQMKQLNIYNELEYTILRCSIQALQNFATFFMLIKDQNIILFTI